MATTPRFWWQPDKQWQATFLSPLSLIWQVATRKRLSKTGYRSTLPVICVGNVTIGGSGKTPTVIGLVKNLRENGWSPVVLLRGYGGSVKNAHQVTATDDAQLVGDEALLHRQNGPTVVSADRAAGARLAETLGDIIVMDDGLQNPQLEKDVSVLVVDAERGYGNGCVIPAGPIREPLQEVVKRIDCVLAIGSGNVALPTDTSIFRAHVSPNDADSFAEKKVVAFAGIAQPQKFYSTLKTIGADILKTRDFADHAQIPASPFNELVAFAHDNDALVVTTEKDFVRLPAAWRPNVVPLKVNLEADTGFFEFVVEKLASINRTD